MILWSGAVVPAYQQFFQELAHYMRVRVLAPRKWMHGSVSFHATPRSQTAQKNQCEIIPTLYIPEKSSRYWVPALILHLWIYRPHYLYIMDELDRLSLSWHALIAKLAWPKVKIISYSLQNLKSPRYHRWYHGLATRLNQGLVSKGIAASDEAHQIMLANGFRGQTQIIPLWASENTFYPGEKNSQAAFRSRHGLLKEDIVLLFSGSLVEAKGLHLLQQVLPQFPKIKLVVAGLGPLENALRQTLGKQFIFLGALESQELRQFYQAGDFIILPSLTLDYWKEQIGRSLIEGILCGCIAIGSDSGYIPTLTLFPEATFEQGNLLSLTALLNRLPILEKDKIRKAQQLNIEQNYTAKAVARKTAAFLQDKS